MADLGIFEDCECLTNNEVYEFLKDDDSEFHVLKDLIKFLEQVKSNLGERHVNEIREFLNDFDLTEFEVVKIIDLLPGVLEEFKSVIPSVSEKLNDTEMNKIIAFLKKYIFILLDSDEKEDNRVKRPREEDEEDKSNPKRRKQINN